METQTEIKLTSFSKGSGCGCKVAPSVLQKILEGNATAKKFPGLLVGSETNDDAAVMEINGDSCLVSTTDFFTPVVDDAFNFGRIAAANAISDVYAMGGKPILAIAILGWPVDKLPPELAGDVIAGGRAVCDEAGIPLAGGHTIDNPEPFFGLAVNGIVNKSNLKKNNGSREGDLLFITKPIGSGVLSSAIKRGKISEEDLKTALGVMTALNSAGEKLGKMAGVHALTDVTGFGLLGHLIEMAEGSGVSAKIFAHKIPLIPGIEKYTGQMIFPDNVYRNWNSYEQKTAGIDGPAFITLCDPQTNGGLLVSLDPGAEKDFQKFMQELGLRAAFASFGTMMAKEKAVVTVVP